MIRIEHLKKSYPAGTPLLDVNAEIKRGEVISVIGPSGTGKSTLLRCLNLLETPTAGRIFIDGEEITDKNCKVHLLRRKMGMVFQSFNLFHHLTVIENIMAAPVELRGKTRQEAYDQGMELLRKVGLADRALAYPDELSGGQKQRVAIARTLAMEPEILLFDEPTSALDPTMVGEVLAVIRGLAESGLTMLIVTHEMQFARDVSTRIFYMDEGEIYEDGTPEQIFEHPQREKTRQFILRLKVLEERIESRNFDFIGINTRIEEFGRKHLMNQKMIRSAMVLFEELCVQTILPRQEEVGIVFALEFADRTGEATLRLRYQGARFDPLAEGETLPLLLAKNAADIEYDYTPDGSYPNTVTARLK